MRKYAGFLILAMLGITAPKVWADGTGLTLTAVLTLYTPDQTPLRPQAGATNYFDSVNGLVPPGYGNSTTSDTAVIGDGIEFAVSDATDLFTMNFTGLTVTVRDFCLAAGCGQTAFTAEVYSPYITGYSVVTDDFPYVSFGYGYDFYAPGAAGSMTFFGGPDFDGGQFTLAYSSITPPATPTFSPLALRSFALANAADSPQDPAAAAVTPEPGTFGLMATGLIGAAHLIRRRFVSK